MSEVEKTMYPDVVRNHPESPIRSQWLGYHLPPSDDIKGLTKSGEDMKITAPPCGDECEAEKMAFEEKKADLIAQQPWTGWQLSASQQEKAVDDMPKGQSIVSKIINGLDKDVSPSSRKTAPSDRLTKRCSRSLATPPCPSHAHLRPACSDFRAVGPDFRAVGPHRATRGASRPFQTSTRSRAWERPSRKTSWASRSTGPSVHCPAAS